MLAPRMTTAAVVETQGRAFWAAPGQHQPTAPLFAGPVLFYLLAPGLSWGMGNIVPRSGRTLGPLYWKCRVLTLDHHESPWANRLILVTPPCNPRLYAEIIQSTLHMLTDFILQ